MKIMTDHKWKPFRYRSEVPAKVLKSQFNYQDEEDTLDGFFRYRGYWYHQDGFVRIDAGAPFGGPWNGYASDSFFSGVLIEVSSDGEQYRVGTYIS